MIKPIPCNCGQTPVVIPKDPVEEGGAWGAVQCRNSKCPVQPTMYDGVTIADDRDSDEYKEAAIKRWNKWIRGEGI